MKTKLLLLLLMIVLYSPTLYAGIYFNSATGWSWNKLILKSTAKEQNEYCQKLEKSKKYSSAIDHYELLIKVYPKSPEAVEAYMRIGELYIEQGMMNRAQKYFENLLNLQIEETSKVIHTMHKNRKKKKGAKLDEKTKQMMFQILIKDLQKSSENNSENPLLKLNINRIFDNLIIIAKAYIKGSRYQLFNTLPLWKQKGKFQEIYYDILLRAPNYVNCPSMQKEIALYKLKKKKYFEAITEFKKLSYEYSLSPEAEDTAYYIGLCHLKSSKGPAYNQENIDIADAHISDYLLSQPDGDKAKDAKNIAKLIEEERSENNLIKIKFFIRRHQWMAAKIYIKETLQKYPDTKFALEAKSLALKYKKIGAL